MPTRTSHDLISPLVAFALVGVLGAVWPHPGTAPPLDEVAIKVAAPPAKFAPSPVPAQVLTEVAGGPPTARTVALTFDDGPDPRWTPEVLDLLARYDAVATFCVVGEQVERHEDLVRRVVDAGMRLCNHSHSHDTGLGGRTADVVRREVAGTRADLVAVAGAPVPYFRAPGGNWSGTVAELSAEHGMRPLGWSVDSRDWKQPGTAEILRRVQRQMHPGAVVLLHDGGGRRGQTVAALAELLPWLVRNCYAFTFPDG
jgi:peptidoglycan-N-acetylglucosamine deacetylase